MPEHSAQRPLLRRPDIKCANGTVNARRSKNSRTVLIPVMGECFGGRGRATGLAGNSGGGGCRMNRNLGDEVVGSGGRGAEIENTHV